MGNCVFVAPKVWWMMMNYEIQHFAPRPIHYTIIYVACAVLSACYRLLNICRARGQFIYVAPIENTMCVWVKVQLARKVRAIDFVVVRRYCSNHYLKRLFRVCWNRRTKGIHRSREVASTAVLKQIRCSLRLAWIDRWIYWNILPIEMLPMFNVWVIIFNRVYWNVCVAYLSFRQFDQFWSIDAAIHNYVDTFIDWWRPEEGRCRNV